MIRTFCHSKIHRAVITSVKLEYEGSITIDSDLLEKADIKPFEQVHIFNINNGNRFITYAIEGERGSDIIQINGAAARLCSVGDLAIIVSYCQITEEESLKFKPKIVYCNSQEVNKK